MINKRIYYKRAVLLSILMVGLIMTLAQPLPASSMSMAAQSEAAAPAARYYVAKTGDGTNPTLGWSTAFNNVQDALAAAILAGGGEIWVAAGVYYPDVGSGQADKDVNSTFILRDGVALYGGFDTDDIHMAERDWETNITVLSGDIDKFDVVDENGVVGDWTDIGGDNAYHVVTADGVSGSAILDGFTITAGDAHGMYPDNRGGGLHCDGSGIANECSPSLINVVFSGNRADYYGGGMFNYAEDGGTCRPTLTNVTFTSNFARDSGGAIFNRAIGSGSSCSPSLTGVRIYCGEAEVGGGIFCQGNGGTCKPELTNVLISGNSAYSGAGMYNMGNNGGSSNPNLINVVLSGNHAISDGGAMYSHAYGGNCSPMLTNVTISGNSAGDEGGGMYNYESNLGDSRPEANNSIIWNNRDSSGTGLIGANIYNKDVDMRFKHSLLQGAGVSDFSWIGGSYLDGGGNIDGDPQFIFNVDPTTAPTEDGDLRLKKSSPAVEAGDNILIGGIHTDLDGEQRVVDGDGDYYPVVDMGAYEYQVYYWYLPLTNR